MADDQDNPGIKVPPPLIYLLPLVSGLLLDRKAPAPFLPRGAARGLGWALIGGGALLVGWFRKTMREADAPVRTDRPVPRLTTSGPFRFTRNPAYVALAMIYTGRTPPFEALSAKPDPIIDGDGHRFEMIQLTVAPWARLEDVANTFRNLQREVLGPVGRLGGRRNLEVFRFVEERRDWDGKRPSWRKLLEAWNREHGEEVLSEKEREKQVRNFSRYYRHAREAMRTLTDAWGDRRAWRTSITRPPTTKERHARSGNENLGPIEEPTDRTERWRAEVRPSASTALWFGSL